ncbi:hypothetical protein GIB67_014017 [Kingdonia uniflora]|uniref:Uncharacterized protein n=1 Tax=Kingdonia uniflora TaxID=39325 RepID=A0A7J7L5P7_9MAGN|nr:hypothetical protein GIB67_014017 [Kingdonia uniflora]
MRAHSTFTTVIKGWKDISTIPLIRDVVYWFYEYCGVGHPIVNEELTGEARIPLDPSLSMSPHISPAALQEMRLAGFLNCEQFVIEEERKTYASYWAEQTLELVPGLQFAWRGGGARPGVAHGVDWEARDAPHRPLEGPATHVCLLRHRGAVVPDSCIDGQLYSHDLHLRRGHDVWVVPLPPGGGTRMRQRGSGPRTRGGDTSFKGRGPPEELTIVKDPQEELAVVKNLPVELAIVNDPPEELAIVKDPPEKLAIPQMSSSSSDSFIGDPPGVSSFSSDDLIFDCATTIYVLHQTAINLVVDDATSSHGGSVMGRKDKKKK